MSDPQPKSSGNFDNDSNKMSNIPLSGTSVTEDTEVTFFT